MVAVCAPGPISYDGGGGDEDDDGCGAAVVVDDDDKVDVVAAVVELPFESACANIGLPLLFPLLRERSKIRSFFSAPPVATI